MKEDKNRKRILLGLGLDNDDGHKRITQSEDFILAGGSHETHEKMTETVIKTREDLRQRGKTLSSADNEELADMLEKNRPKD